MYQDSQVLNLNIDDILPNRFQPRIKFNEQAINELADSIKVHGVIQPIVVRKISDKYEIIAGERRYKASVLAGKTTIPAIVVSLDDKNSAEIALIENVQRQNLTPIEEAISYKKILDMGYISQVALGEKLGKTQSTIANKLRLLNLNEEVQDALMDGKISERHARSLLKLNDAMQVVMLNRIINERLTVRKTDEEIDKLLNDSEENGSQKEKEGKNEMNNDILKDLNIPTEPIIEDIDEKLNTINDNMIKQIQEETLNQTSIPTPTNDNITNSIEINNNSINDFSSLNPINLDEENKIIPDQLGQQINEENNNQQINPGFMDVEKIESSAQEIYKEPSPVADIDMLLDTSKNPIVEEESPMQMPIENSIEEPVTGGKFFTMFNMNKEEENPNYISDIESKEVNMDFGVPTNEINSVQNFNFDAFNQTVDNETNEENNNSITETEEIPSLDENMFPPINTADSDEVISKLENVEVQNNELDLEKTMDFTKPFETYSLTDDEKFTNNLENISKIETSEVIKPSISPISIPNEIKFDDMGEIEVKLPETQPQLTAASFKTVINTIRECAKTIEKFGFTIDTEEIDLEDSYEVIFKIDKN